MRITIDRIEEDVAIVQREDGEIVYMSKHLVPRNAKEDDVLIISIDKQNSIRREEEINALLEEVWHDRGDIDNM